MAELFFCPIMPFSLKDFPFLFILCLFKNIINIFHFVLI